jgi:hypothetical protein
VAPLPLDCPGQTLLSLAPFLCGSGCFCSSGKETVALHRPEREGRRGAVNMRRRCFAAPLLRGAVASRRAPDRGSLDWHTVQHAVDSGDYVLDGKEAPRAFHPELREPAYARVDVVPYMHFRSMPCSCSSRVRCCAAHSLWPRASLSVAAASVARHFGGSAGV